MSMPEASVGRGRGGCWLFAMPIAAAFVVVGMYAVVMVAGFLGREATGPRVRVALTGCPAAEPLVRERVEVMGLGDPVFEPIDDGFAVTATMPGDPEAAAEIPATLARPGRFTLRDAAGAPIVDHEQIASVMLQWGLLGEAKVQLTLDADGTRRLSDWVSAHAGEQPVATIDDLSLPIPGDALGRSPDTIAITPTRTEPRRALAEIAAWALILEHGPLPCAPRVAVTGPG